MRINKKITVLFIVFLAVIFLLPDAVLAQGGDTYGQNDLINVNLSTKNLKDVITDVINISLGFLGIIATIIILYGGFIWMTSRGNADSIGRAKKIIINGVIGLAIILSSYAIVRFILVENYDNIFGPGGGGPGGGYSGGIGLGSSVLDNHYPARNAHDVPRNTNIYVTFKVPMDVENILSPAEDPLCTTNCMIDSNHIKLYRNDDAIILEDDELLVTFNVLHKVFEFNPYGDTANHLGQSDGEVPYTMVLDGLSTEEGDLAFPITGYYDWNFEVSNELDLIPPKVTSVIPTGVDNPRNSVVQVNFSEAVNPMYATGVADDLGSFVAISVWAPDPIFFVEGEYLISNQYRTVELITEEFCGVNSCGGDVFCLPENADLTGTVKGDGAVPDVITDMAGNILDGDDNEEAGGDYIWEFFTNDSIYLVPPVMTSMTSGGGIPVSDPILATFDVELLSSSVNSDSISFHHITEGDMNYWLGVTDGDTVNIYQDRLDPVEPYHPTLTSGIKDGYQNCWAPCVCNDPAGASCDCDDAIHSGTCPGTNCVSE